jgi:Tfp pilus assembly protein PilV
MNKNFGFTFAEVLLSLFVLVVSVYILSDLQFGALKRVNKSVEIIDRIFLIKKELYQLYLTPPTKDKIFKKVIVNPDLTITAHKQKIDPKKSDLKEFEKEIDIVWTEGNWTSGPYKRSIKMISFVEKSQVTPKPQDDKKPQVA